MRTALTRKNFLFAGSDAGGDRAAIAFTILGSCRLAGVDPIAWLINPRLRTLEVLRLHEAMWLVLGICRDDARVRAEPFEACELERALLWADLGPPLRAAEVGARYGEAPESVLRA